MKGNLIGNQLIDQMASVDGSQGISAMSFHKMNASPFRCSLINTSMHISATWFIPPTPQVIFVVWHWIVLITTLQIIGLAEDDHISCQQVPPVWSPWIIIIRVAWGSQSKRKDQVPKMKFFKEFCMLHMTFKPLHILKDINASQILVEMYEGYSGSNLCLF